MYIDMYSEHLSIHTQLRTLIHTVICLYACTHSYTHTHTKLSICRDNLLAGCFLALALLPASPLCDLMQVLPHSSSSPSLFSTFSFSIYLCSPALKPLLFSSFLLSFLFLLYFELPLCMYHIIHPLHLSLTLACFHCL